MSRLPHQKKPCVQCPFRKDILEGWLGAERMTQILETDSFVCHKKTGSQCAGHMLLIGDENAFVRLAKVLNIDLALSGRELVFDTKQDCNTHHDWKK